MLTFDDGYRDFYTNAWPVLERYGFTATIFLVSSLVGRDSHWGHQQGTSAAPLMSWDEIRELNQLGFDFGSHTVTHERLTCLDDRHAKREIEQSKAELQEHLGITVDMFSYPYGAANARVRRMVSECGYIAACGVDRGPWGKLNIWRTECAKNDSLRVFAMKAYGIHHSITWLREQTLAGKSFLYLARALRRHAVGTSRSR